jgi:hypothetical protein
LQPATVAKIEEAKGEKPRQPAEKTGKKLPVKDSAKTGKKPPVKPSGVAEKPAESFQKTGRILPGEHIEEHTDCYSVLRTDAAAETASSATPPIQVDIDLNLASPSDGIELVSPSQEPKAPETPKTKLWKEGVPLLANSGVPEDRARKHLGRWMRETNNDAIRILKTLEAASEKQIFDWVPWVNATLKNGKPIRTAWMSRRDQKAQKNADAHAALMSLTGGRYAN